AAREPRRDVHAGVVREQRAGREQLDRRTVHARPDADDVPVRVPGRRRRDLVEQAQAPLTAPRPPGAAAGTPRRIFPVVVFGNSGGLTITRFTRLYGASAAQRASTSARSTASTNASSKVLPCAFASASSATRLG